MTLLLVNIPEHGQRYQLCFALGKTRWYRPAGATAVINSRGLITQFCGLCGGTLRISAQIPLVFLLYLAVLLRNFHFIKLQAIRCWTELLATDNGNTSFASMAKFLYLYPIDMKSKLKGVNWCCFLSYGGRECKASVLRLLKISSLNGITLTCGCYWDDHSVCSL